MINSLPQSSDFTCEVCKTTTYVYCKFKNYLANNTDEPVYFESNVETSQSSDNQENHQILPITSKSEESLNPETPEINSSEVVGANGKKGFPATLNKTQPDMHPPTNGFMYKSLKKSLDNNLTDCSKKVDVPKTRVKRKLFDTVVHEVLPKKAAKKDDTYKFLPGLSDSIADNFLQQFDRENGVGSVGESGKDLSKQCNLESHRNLPKRRTDQRHRKAAPLLKEESSSPSGDGDINQSDLTSTSDQSSNTDQTESTEKNDNEDIQKKINFLERSNSRSSVSSDTDSVSSIGSNVSRYGRIRKPSSVYVNATMFKGSINKSAEVKQKASTLINSHQGQNGPTRSFEANSRYCPNQLDILTQTHKSMVSPQFKKFARKVTLSKNKRTTRKFQNNRKNSSWRNSSFIEDLPELPHNTKILELDEPTRQTTAPAIESNFVNEKLELQNGTVRPAALIGDYSEQLNFNQSPVCSQCKQTATLNGDRSAEKDIFKKPLATNKCKSIRSLKQNEASSKSQKIVIDNSGKKFNPNEIHAVVKDEVVSLKWHSAMPDLESVLGNGANVYYSMRDLKSFYTNLTVGYLKINAGHKTPMTLLKDYILLFFVERGEGIFQVSGRKITGQIGGTVFIPLGVEYSITNSNREEDFILKFVIISPTN